MTKCTKKKSGIFLIFGFLLCIAITVTAADFCSNLIAINAFSHAKNTPNQDPYTVFAISTASAESKSNALEKAALVQKSGGAGFVIEKNGKFFVLASGYLEQNDALLVKENLEKDKISAEIIKLDVSPITITGTYNQNEINALIGAVGIYKTVFMNLYDISVALDTGISSTTQSIMFVADVAHLASKTKLNFDALFGANTSSEILYIKFSLESLIDKLDTLKNFAQTQNNGQNFSSKLKETYLLCLELNILLAEKI